MKAFDDLASTILTTQARKQALIVRRLNELNERQKLARRRFKVSRLRLRLSIYGEEIIGWDSITSSSMLPPSLSLSLSLSIHVCAKEFKLATATSNDI
jgi:hypothetical protein